MPVRCRKPAPRRPLDRRRRGARVQAADPREYDYPQRPGHLLPQVQRGRPVGEAAYRRAVHSFRPQPGQHRARRAVLAEGADPARRHPEPGQPHRDVALRPADRQGQVRGVPSRPGAVGTTRAMVSPAVTTPAARVRQVGHRRTCGFRAASAKRPSRPRSCSIQSEAWLRLTSHGPSRPLAARPEGRPARTGGARPAPRPGGPRGAACRRGAVSLGEAVGVREGFVGQLAVRHVLLDPEVVQRQPEVQGGGEADGGDVRRPVEPTSPRTARRDCRLLAAR